MPQTNSFATCLFSAALVWVAAAQAAPLSLDVMPTPSEATVSAGRFAVGENLDFAIPATADARLRDAVARARARWHTRLAGTAAGVPAVTRLVIECGASGGALPSESDDESYTLNVSGAEAVLRAASDFGVLHGLETFLQLPKKDKDGWFLPEASIRDRPRFPWRGLMIDVARHWQPTEVIERNIDAMAVVKLNVLHLHLTDDQGFRIESLTHPELQGKGSDGKYFTQAQMRAIIAYASGRGVRVIPEFDIPGHATSWVVSHPELASLPGPYGIERQWGVFNPVLDPTNEGTYALLGDFLGEMCALFPDSFMHIGGDENNGVQWNANPSIQAFIRDHGLKDDEGLHAYFNKRVEAILAGHGKRIVGWDEIMNPALPRDCVIDSWRGTDALAASAALGFDGILSNGYYIDLCYPASDHYVPDPIPASSTLSAVERAHILGGEATMWSEWVTPETIDSRIWPRTAAIAERLWSPADVRDVDEMYRRLTIVSARLGEAGSLHLVNQRVMLRHLVGENLEAPGIASLVALMAVLEPVKHYQRGGQQVWSNQLIPLVGLADAIPPESLAAREFAIDADRLLFTPGAFDRAQAESIGERMRALSADAKVVADSLASTYPAVREAVPPCRDLIDACAVGSEAVQSITSGIALSGEKLTAGLAALDNDAAKNESATELPILKPIRLLVAAAARQADHGSLSGEAWKALIVKTAFPETTADAASPKK